MSLLSLGAVTVAEYREHTGDNTTSASAASGALLEAEELVEDHLRRRLALEQRTDTFVIYPDGRVYPDAWPIVDAELTIDGRSLMGAQPDDTPFIGVFDFRLRLRATVTWTGGYDAATLPRTLENVVYELAQAGMARSPVPVGATDLSVGDVSVGFAKPTSGSLDALIPGLSGRIGRYRNRWAS